MKAKRILALFMAITMVFAACSCASTNSGKTETKEKTTAAESTETKSVKEEAAETSEVTEETEEETNKEAMYDSLYDSIEESVLAYFKENNIDAENFSWPVYEENTSEELYTYSYSDEDNSWTYFETILVTYLSSGKMYDTADSGIPLPENENNIKLMNSILDGIVNWSKLPENSSATPGDISSYLYPYYEKIPSNIDLSSAK